VPQTVEAQRRQLACLADLLEKPRDVRRVERVADFVREA
jgi:hypothetical protein